MLRAQWSAVSDVTASAVPRVWDQLFDCREGQEWTRRIISRIFFGAIIKLVSNYVHKDSLFFNGPLLAQEAQLLIRSASLLAMITVFVQEQEFQINQLR